MYLFFRDELKVKLLFLAVLYLTGMVVSVRAQSAPGTAEPGSVLTGISVAEDAGALVVTLPIGNIPIAPRISKLSNPDRLIFDFAGVLPKAGVTKTPVGSHSVKDVRAAIFGNDARGRPITRVVLDLDRPVAYQTRSESGKFVVVIRESETVVPNVAVAPSKVSASPVASRSGETSPAIAGNRLTNIDFGDSSVTLTFASPVTPRKSRLHEPERLVLDIPGVVSGLPSGKSVPEPLRASVTAIRTAQFKENPPVYRIVFDQPAANVSSDLVVSGDRVTVQFGLSPMNAARTATKLEPSTHAKRIPRPRDAMPTASPKSMASAKVANPRTGKTSDSGAGGPRVDYSNGLLRIEASNANLADILYAVAEKTGAAIDMPFSDGMLDQVTFTMGPGKPRDVLSTILEGSGFNYYIVENSTGGLEKIILIPKQQ